MIKVLETDFLEDNYIDKNFIHNMSITSKLTFSKKNIYYFGNYNEDKFEIIKQKLLKYKKSLIRAIENEVRFIICGNSINIFNNNFKSNEINLFTAYDKNNFKKHFNKLTIVKNKTNKIRIKKIKNLNETVDNMNFRYKNLVCLENSKNINEIIKKQSKTTLSCKH